MDATGKVELASLSEDALELNAHIEAVSDRAYGAVATFVGQVRDHDPAASGTVAILEYSAHPDAAAILERIALAASRPGTSIAVSHRVGALKVGEPALIACVASAHRGLAFEVNRDLVERIKAELPVWKLQVEADGRHNWQGLR